MILPSKHIPERKALLTVGAELLKLLERPKTVSSLWEDVGQFSPVTQLKPTHLTYDWFVLSLDLLYTIGTIEIHEGLLKRTIA